VPLGVSEDHLALHETVASWAERRGVLAQARAWLDDADDGLPAFWPELADLGWLGLHVPTDVGGQGFGFAELGVVLEELGRAGAPGPFLPTALAAAVIDRLGGLTRELLLAGLLDGSRPATVAWTALEPLELAGGVVRGTLRPVLAGAQADVIVAPYRAGGALQWCVLDRGDVDVKVLPSIDPARRVAEVVVDGVALADDRRLGPEPADGWVAELAALLLAAESVGGAAWCVEAAAAWARDRVQFGRPIGQFQGVKHRCADMLCAAELARAAVWDGLRAADEEAVGGDAEASRVAVVAAASLGPDAFLETAKGAVQVLGGIGFTWEHDAHLFLKRAIANRLLAGSVARWHAEAAALAAGGARRRLTIDLDGGDEARAAVRAFADALHQRPKEEWRAALVDAGYLAPHWPGPWGREATPIEQLVIDQELREAHIHPPHLNIAGWVLPTLLAHGTPEQLDRWMRASLVGETSWCQLFSEPSAGSDLASVTTRATKVDGGWRLDGQKVWTTMAHTADFGLCVARSDPDAPKHAGLTCFVVDMHSAGLDIRPLRELTGVAMFNEVFFDSVFVPDDCVVGAVGGGWQAARTTLENERVSMGRGASFGPGVEALVHAFATSEDPTTAGTLGTLLIESHALAALGMRLTLRAIGGRGPGPEASVRKLLGVEHEQRVQEAGLLLSGVAATAADGAAGAWVGGFLSNRCLTIAGGTSEVQRNVIGERLLGLPRDP